MTEFIWNAGIASMCDKGTQYCPEDFFSPYSPPLKHENYLDVREGDAVWVGTANVRYLYEKIFPEIKYPFVLVICGGDRSFPSESGLDKTALDAMLSSDKIIHIFSQNCDDQGRHAKISYLPIGMNFHQIAYKSARGFWGETGSPLEQEACLKQILQTLAPTHLRKRGAFVDFQHNDSIRNGNYKRFLSFGEDRTTIFKRLLKTGLIDYGRSMRRSELWRKKGQYAFSISPHGNGLDCFRTWEDLVLGCIVIVKTSPLDPLYEGLPVVIVQDWSEVTAENMENWVNQYGDAFTNPLYREKLTNAYWLQKIRDAGRNLPNKN